MKTFLPLIYLFISYVNFGCNEVLFETNSSSQGNNAVKIFEPALAIRATGCIMCHSQVNSNIITDFGFGDSYFFGQGAPSLTPISGSVYGNHDVNWKSAKLSGNVIVPQADVLSSVGPSTLKEYLEGVLAGSENSETREAKVFEKSKVFIGAPSADRLREAAKNAPRTMPGLQFQNTAGGGYYYVDGELNCSGDLFVDGILYLKKPKIRTNGGCRIYATESVFVDGPVEYLEENSKSNLQIVSARGINLGLGRNTCNGPLLGSGTDSLMVRLTEIWTRGGYFTREAGSVQDKLNDIWNDGQNIGTLVDAFCTDIGRNVEFRKLLLNAPHINSRYLGNFKGVIIAEIAIMSLGAFKYEFDDVFKDVPVLPLLKPTDYLNIKD